jgi:hypothetical protein
VFSVQNLKIGNCMPRRLLRRLVLRSFSEAGRLALAKVEELDIGYSPRRPCPLFRPLPALHVSSVISSKNSIARSE